MTNATPTTQNLTLWIGGSSCLARTFVNTCCDGLGGGMWLCGVEGCAPDWILPSIQYAACDLTKLTEATARKFFNKSDGKVTRIIIGVRPLLFAAYTNTGYSNAMIRGIQTLLRCAEQAGTVKFVLHLSSVAAADHLRAQSFISEEDPVPPRSKLRAPYDLFKRECEDIISTICEEARIPYCHLRMSALFSDDPKCIQCNALMLQCRMGCYLPNPIDCNSSRNVVRAIAAILEKSDGAVKKVQSLYYYTRPLHLKHPEPYGYYLQAFRQAHGMERYSIWIPVWVVTWFVAVFHWIAQWNSFFKVPFVDSADYLLQVSAREHSFDCSRFDRDFPDFVDGEESILDCFVRRRAFLSRADKVKKA